MSHQQQHGSPVRIFLTIYLLISVAVGGAIFFLVRSKNYGEPVAVIETNEVVVESAAPESRAPKPKSPPAVVAKASSKKALPAEASPETPRKKSAPMVAPTPDPVVAEKAAESREPALSAKEVEEIDALFPLPDIKPLLEIVNNWADVPQGAYPKLVAIKKSIDFEVSDNGSVVARGTMPIGSMLVPARLIGNKLTLTAGNAVPVVVTVQVEETDFKELIEMRYNAYAEKTNASTLARRQAERERRLTAIVLEDSLTDWNDGSEPRFEPAKQSLQKGEVGTYSLFDATKWRWGGTEKSEGTEFETAFVIIVSEAAFGVTERELKVFLSKGKAVRWVDAATNEEL